MMPKVGETRGVPVDAKMVQETYALGTAYWLVVERDGDALTGTAWGYACVGDPENGEWGTFRMHDIKNVGARMLRRAPMAFPAALGIAQNTAAEFARIRSQMSDALCDWC